MTALPEWFAQISSGVVALDGLRMRPVETAERRATWEKGFPAFLPVWRRAGVTVSLLATPGQAPGQWRGVIEHCGQALTLSENAATLLPRYLFTRYISNNPEGVELLVSSWDGLHEALVTLHGMLGGDASTLEPLRQAIADPALRRAFEFDEDRRARFEAAHSRLARQIDASQEFSRYADWIDGAIAGRLDPQRRIDAYGRWANQLLARFAEMSAAAGIALDRHAGDFAKLLEELAGLDAAVPNIPTWECQPGSGSSEALHASVAARLEPASLPPDPVSKGIVQALKDYGMNYDGRAHAEAVVALDEGGEPQRAWRALQSAAWWMARGTGEAQAPIWDGALLLCDRHGWEDIRWVVEHSSGGGE